MRRLSIMCFFQELPLLSIDGTLSPVALAPVLSLALAGELPLFSFSPFPISLSLFPQKPRNAAMLRGARTLPAAARRTKISKQNARFLSSKPSAAPGVAAAALRAGPLLAPAASSAAKLAGVAASKQGACLYASVTRLLHVRALC